MEERIDDGHLLGSGPYYAYGYGDGPEKDQLEAKILGCSTDHAGTRGRGLCHLRESSLLNFLDVRCFVARRKSRWPTVELFCGVLESNRLLERVPYVKDVRVQFLRVVNIILVTV